jgi:hypothetical protein
LALNLAFCGSMVLAFLIAPGYLPSVAPRRIRVWREANVLEGRTIMRDGRWPC